MNRIFQLLMSPMLFALIGILALCAIVWEVGPVIAIGQSRPFEPLWVRLLIVVLLLGGWLLRLVWKLWQRKRTNAALVNGMAKGPSAADREIGTLNERFSQALDVIKKAPSGSRSVFMGGAYLYELPWYIFVGAPG